MKKHQTVTSRIRKFSSDKSVQSIAIKLKYCSSGGSSDVTPMKRFMIKKRSLVQFSYRQCWNIIKKSLVCMNTKAYYFLGPGYYLPVNILNVTLSNVAQILLFPTFQNFKLFPFVSQYSKQYYPTLILELKQCFHFLKEVT